MDEKSLRRQILSWLMILFAIFTSGFFFLAYIMADRVYTTTKQKEYYVVGKCFHYTFLETLENLKEISKGAVEHVKDLDDRKIGQVFGSMKISFGINGMVVANKFGRYIFSSYEKVPGIVSGYIINAIKDRKLIYGIAEVNGEVSAISVAPIITEEGFAGVVAVVKGLSKSLMEAKETLGGDFDIVRWQDVPEVSKAFEEGREYVIIKRSGFIEVYYDVYNGKYYVHWKEKNQMAEVMFRTFLMVFGISIPFFFAFLFLISLLRKRIIDNFVKPLLKTIDVLDDLVATTSSSSEELAAASEELAASTKDLEERGRSLSKLADDVMNDLEKTLEFSEEVVSFSEFFKKALGNLEKLANELAESMQEIQKMGGLIQQIGERIVVLSINASIEGSREKIDRQAIKALADEIGNLSETTTERVSEIFSSLQAGQEKLDEMSSALRNILVETEKLSDGARRLHEMVTSNRGEFEKVSETIQGMFTTVEEVNFASQNLAEAATELSRKSYEVQRVVDEIIFKNKKDESESGEEEEKGGEG